MPFRKHLPRFVPLIAALFFLGASSLALAIGLDPTKPPKLPSVGELPEAPKLPGGPELPSPGEVPDPSKLPKLPGVPEVPDPSKLPKPPTPPDPSKFPKPPKPPKVPGAPDPSALPKPPGMDEIVSELPPEVQRLMPVAGLGGIAQVSCLQKGRLDLTRPSLPLLTCWESAPAGGESAEDLRKACTVNMTPIKGVVSLLVPVCEPKALGTCIGAKNGKGGTSNHYHYTPQPIPDWIKARKNCRRAGGRWYGLGNLTGWF